MVRGRAKRRWTARLLGFDVCYFEALLGSRVDLTGHLGLLEAILILISLLRLSYPLLEAGPVLLVEGTTCPCTTWSSARG